jgi:predicted metallopeptidase
MGRKEHVYSRVKDAEEIIKKLCEKYPDVMWAVRPETVVCYGIENKEKPKSSNVLAKIKPVKGSEKAIFQENGIKARYIIETYWSDWNEFSEKMKQYVIFHELLHIHPEIGRLIAHDSQDFCLMVGNPQIGVKWTERVNELPDLLIGDVKFDLSLRPSIDTDEDNEKDEIDDVLDEVKKENDAKKEKA